MPDGEMTARDGIKRTRTAPDGAGRVRRSPAARPEPEPAFARREVVVQGMRITLPALRFMETAPPPGTWPPGTRPPGKWPPGSRPR